MQAPLRPTQIRLACAPLAALFLIACSVQNFDYLTRGRGSTDSGGDGPVDAPADTSAASEGGSDGTSDAADATEVADATGDTGRDVAMENDAMDAQEDGSEDAPPSEGGTVAPNLLANPNFDQGLAGWTFVPPSAGGKYAFTQLPIGTATTPQGQTYELATYSMSDAFTVQVSQTLTNLPDGTYAFTGFFNRGPNNSTYIFAKNCGGPAQQMAIPISTATGWDQVSLAGIQVTGGTCQVGFYVDANAGNWLNADGFRFELVTLSPTDASPADGSPRDATTPDAGDAGTE